MGSTPIAEPPVAVAPPPEKRGLAPAWHTILLVVVMLALALSGTSRSQKASAAGGHIAVYLMTIAYQWVLVAFIAFGLHLHGKRLREIIGGRWNSIEAVLTDFAIGVGTWFVMIMSLAIGIQLLHLRDSLTNSGKELMHKLAPQSALELTLFFGLALTAGFCEEVIFRGYLQQQFKAWSKNRFIAILGSTILFGLGHVYQGWLAVVPTMLGLILALLAEWRKSLRPGMILHAWQDSLAGIAQHFASKMKL